MKLHGELKKEVLEKLYTFCAYQERCKQDVIKKLNRLEIPNRFHQSYLQNLEEEKFLNESRYADYYVTGKLNNNKWGKRKIQYALRQKGLPDSLIDQALSHIKEEEYLAIAKAVATKKLKSVKTTDAWKTKQKVYAYLAQKGFENEVIQPILEELV